MIALGIRYLCGWAMATHPADRKRPEWPPHPDRVFQALTAAHFETDGGQDEYEVLRFLSAQPAPNIVASPHHARDAVTTFVPVNGDKAADVSSEGSPLFPQSWAIRRSRQPREFPVAIPDNDVVQLIWPDAQLDPRLQQALEQLCLKVASIGHSASLVQVWVELEPAEPGLVPCEWPEASHRLRSPHPDRVEELQTLYANGVRPTPTGWVGYGKPRVAASRADRPATSFSPNMIVLRRIGGAPLGLESTLLLTEIMRQATIRLCPEPVPEWISGHDGPDGPPSRFPHLGFLPLADVGQANAEGRLLGLALAIPFEDRLGPVDSVRQRAALGPLIFDEEGNPRTIELRGGGLSPWVLLPEDRESPPVTLRAETWTAAGWAGGSDTWATVTPIVLDRYPKATGEAETIIARACRHVGLPEPVEVVVTPSPWFRGVPHARRFPPFLGGDMQARRFHIHAKLRFVERVDGPVVLGAGRYRGYGLCRPWRGATT